jgi:hypothetical protein
MTGHGMAKITIYVPDDLKAKMDAAEDLNPNWSAVAQVAFSLECERIANRRRSKGKMNEVVERLRASKENYENAEKVAGHAAGREWAAKRAEYAELEQIAAIELGYEQEWGYEIAKVLTGDDDPSINACQEAWKFICDSERPTEDFAEAFAEGATEVFEEVNAAL